MPELLYYKHSVTGSKGKSEFCFAFGNIEDRGETKFIVFFEPVVVLLYLPTPEKI